MWKKINNYPDYEVSNTGLVRSLNRCTKNRKDGVTHKLKGLILQPNKKGKYPQVCLSNQNGRKFLSRHTIELYIK